MLKRTLLIRYLLSVFVVCEVIGVSEAQLSFGGDDVKDNDDDDSTWTAVWSWKFGEWPP